MHQLSLALQGSWKVLVAGMILGAGLPSLFAIGIRSLAYGEGGDAELSHAKGNLIGKVMAGIMFALVLAAIALGILTIVAAGFGKSVSYTHIYPVLVDKKH